MGMGPKQNIRMAVEAVWLHRFRSLLTVLGIVIGITTVVTVASLLTGLRKGVVVFFEELGPDNIFVFKTSGNPAGNGVSAKERRRRPLRLEYADVISRSAGSLLDVGSQMFIPGVVQGRALIAKVRGFESDTFSIVGQTPNMDTLAPHDFQEGRPFTNEENSRGQHVAVLGADISDALFPNGHSAGNTFMMDGAEYTVVGHLAKAKGGFFGQNGIDTQVTIPLVTARNRYPQINRFMFVCKAKPGMRKQAYDEVDGIMRRVRHLATATPDDFSLSTPDQIIAQFDQITSLIGLVAIAISGLGLLVGGIGVMNIMLVSVTERTREIGIRKAIGARRGDIISQFLFEAMALTGVGGIMGITISILVTLLISLLVPSLPSTVPTWAIGAGLSVSVATGLFFGTWPAVKAAQLDPVEALRYE
jgi:putative ABC transport system permease protein